MKSDEKLIRAAFDKLVDGKSPAKDGAAGAAIGTGGLLVTAAIVAAPITVPVLLLSAGLGAVAGLFKGAVEREKKRSR